MTEEFCELDWLSSNNSIGKYLRDKGLSDDADHIKKVWDANKQRAKIIIDKFIDDKSKSSIDAILVRFYDSRVEHKKMIAPNKLEDHKTIGNIENQEVMLGLLYTRESARGSSCNAYYFTLEEPWRNNKKIKKIIKEKEEEKEKIVGISCIPNGTYSLYKRDHTKIPFGDDKNKYTYDYYQLFPEGYELPEKYRIEWKPRDKLIKRTYEAKAHIKYNGYSRSQILIHSGNHVEHIEGCILLGEKIDEAPPNESYKYKISGNNRGTIPILKTFQDTNILELDITDVFNFKPCVPPYGSIPEYEPLTEKTNSKKVSTQSEAVAEAGLNHKKSLKIALNSRRALKFWSIFMLSYITILNTIIQL